MAKSKRSPEQMIESRLKQYQKHYHLLPTHGRLQGLAVISEYTHIPTKTLLRWAESHGFPLWRSRALGWWTTVRDIDRWLQFLREAQIHSGRLHRMGPKT